MTTAIEHMLTGPKPSNRVAYTIDPAHSCVSFSIRHMMVTNIRGRFNRIEGSIGFTTA